MFSRLTGLQTKASKKVKNPQHFSYVTTKVGYHKKRRGKNSDTMP